MEYIKTTFTAFCEAFTFFSSEDKEETLEETPEKELNPITDVKTEPPISFFEVDTEPVVDPMKIRQNLSILTFEKFMAIDLEVDGKKKEIIVPEFEIQPEKTTSIESVFVNNTSTTYVGTEK